MEVKERFKNIIDKYGHNIYWHTNVTHIGIMKWSPR